MWEQILDVVAASADNKNSNSATNQVLLVLHSLVHRQEDIESGLLCQGQQFTVRLSSEASRGNGLAVMPGERVLYPSRQAFINQNSHCSFERTNCLPSSRASMAISRETVGKSSRKSSSVW